MLDHVLEIKAFLEAGGNVATIGIFYLLFRLERRILFLEIAYEKHLREIKV